MQIKKESVKERIRSSAYKVFQKKGYIGASLEAISERASISKGNIYRYYKNKDHLYSSLVEPAMAFIVDSMESSKRESPESIYFIRSTESTRKEFKQYAEALRLHTDGFRLLFLCSSGSSFENFREEIIQLYSKRTMSFYESLKKENPELDGDLSLMFIHSLAASFLNFIEEVVHHDPDDDELKNYIDQMAVFIHQGVRSVLDNCRKKIRYRRKHV